MGAGDGTAGGAAVDAAGLGAGARRPGQPAVPEGGCSLRRRAAVGDSWRSLALEADGVGLWRRASRVGVVDQVELGNAEASVRLVEAAGGVEPGVVDGGSGRVKPNGFSWEYGGGGEDGGDAAAAAAAEASGVVARAAGMFDETGHRINSRPSGLSIRTTSGEERPLVGRVWELGLDRDLSLVEAAGCGLRDSGGGEVIERTRLCWWRIWAWEAS